MHFKCSQQSLVLDIIHTILCSIATLLHCYISSSKFKNEIIKDAKFQYYFSFECLVFGFIWLMYTITSKFIPKMKIYSRKQKNNQWTNEWYQTKSSFPLRNANKTNERKFGTQVAEKRLWWESVLKEKKKTATLLRMEE